MKKNSGFSLFEILLVITVSVVVIVFANQALFTTLKSGTKSQVTSNIKQAASYALEIIERELRPAKQITSCTSQSVILIDEEGVEVTISCVNVGNAGYISIDGSRLTSDTVAVSSCQFTCTTAGEAVSVDIDMTFTQTGGQDLRAEDKATYRQKSLIKLRN